MIGFVDDATKAALKSLQEQDKTEYIDEAAPVSKKAWGSAGSRFDFSQMEASAFVKAQQRIDDAIGYRGYEFVQQTFEGWSLKCLLLQSTSDLALHVPHYAKHGWRKGKVT